MKRQTRWGNPMGPVGRNPRAIFTLISAIHDHEVDVAPMPVLGRLDVGVVRHSEAGLIATLARAPSELTGALLFWLGDTRACEPVMLLLHSDSWG